MLIRVRTPCRMYRITIDYNNDTFRNLRENLATHMRTHVDDIIISNTRNYEDILLDGERIDTISLKIGDILYAKSVSNSEKVDTKPKLLSHVKKRWTFHELKEYEERNRHVINLGETTLKRVSVDKKLIDGFIHTCKNRGYGVVRKARLYGRVKGDVSIVETLFIPEQISSKTEAIVDITREGIYKDGLDIIIRELDLTHIGDIIFFPDDWKSSQRLLDMINKSKANNHFINLIANVIDGKISVEAYQPDNSIIELHRKNIVFAKFGRPDTLCICEEHTIVINKHDIKDDIDIQFFFTPIPIVHKNGKFRTHELTFMDGWKYKRRYNFKQFRRYMRINCPVPKLINDFIHDIAFLIYIRQWFSTDDYKLLLKGIRRNNTTEGFKLVVCGICGIQ